MSGELREAQRRQEYRAEIMRGYQAALCNSDIPGWTLGDEVAKVADNLLAAHPVEPARLREALAALHVLVDAPTGGGDRYSYCAVDGYESDDLAENPCPTLALLAAHPVEPAPVADRYRLAWLSARRRASVAAEAFYAEARASRGLEEMQPASVADPARITEVLKAHGQRIQPSGAACKCGWTERIYGSALWTESEWEDHLTDALLVAGVFRSVAEVKAEALEAEAARTYRDGGYDYPFAASEIAAFLKARAAALRAGDPS